jgi:lantibiotic modifying enzyme
MHLCCGTFGLVEALLVAGQRADCPAWIDRARGLAGALVARADLDGGHRVLANLPAKTFSPSLFLGTTGIGYQLLRLADPSLPSVLAFE